jgi:hypothetical protein
LGDLAHARRSFAPDDAQGCYAAPAQAQIH